MLIRVIQRDKLYRVVCNCKQVRLRGKNVTGEEEPLHDDVIRDF